MYSRQQFKEYGKRMYRSGLESGHIKYLKLASRIEKRTAKRDRLSERLEEKREKIYTELIDRLKYAEEITEKRRVKILSDAKIEADKMMNNARDKLTRAENVLSKVYATREKIKEEFENQRSIALRTERVWRDGTAVENEICSIRRDIN